MFTAKQKRLEILLKQARIDAGLTQKELAQRLETSHTRVSDYERGQRRMDLVELDFYCEALGISLQDFVRRYREGNEESDASEQKREDGEGSIP